MKELSTEEKAKRYDEAIEKARKLAADLPNGRNDRLYHVWDLESIFPELKESDDERIRKELISLVKYTKGLRIGYEPRVSQDDMIAWIENKGEQKSTWSEEDDILQRFSFYSYKDEPDILYLAGVYVNESNRNQGIGTKILEVADEVATSMGCHVIRLKTQKDTDAYRLYRKNGYNFLTDEGNQVWLEKKGEQKHKIQPKFKIGDVIRFKGNETLKGEAEAHKIVGYDNELYVFADGTTDLFCEQDLYELVEQKPAVIIPKFKVGDWITNGIDFTFQVCSIEDNMYLRSDDYFIDIETADKTFRLWTIQDPKDGDVLYDNDTNTVFIFKSQACGWIKVYCDFWITKNKFTGTDPADYGRVNEMDFKPATKEQRDLLFQMMKEAGYEWDAEKKELVKIEQKPTNSVIEEEKPLLEKFKQAVYDCAWGKVTCKKEGETKEEYANRWAEQFLLIVRDWADDYIDFTIQQKFRKIYDTGKEDAIKENSLAWSEEDEQRVENLLAIIEGRGYPSEVRWLENLENRVQPQTKQKWNDEDEIGLSDALWAIKQARTIAKDENDMGNFWYAERWLKSLKERIGE